MTSTDHTPAALDSDTLARVAAQVRTGEDDVADLVSRLRAAQLVVEVEASATGSELVPVVAQGLRWLPVFSSLEYWAQFLVAAGRGEDTIGYGWLSGSELFDEVVPQLAAGTGVVLDPLAEHVLALPPAKEIHE